MKNPKSIRETMPEEKLKEVEAIISATKDPKTKHLIEQMLFMTFEELDSLKEELERRGYWKDDE